MVKKFSADCDFGGQKQKMTLYVGDPVAGANPLSFQNKLLQKKYGGSIPADIMNFFDKMSKMSDYNKVAVEDLYSYTHYEIESQKKFVDDFNLASEFTKGEFLEDETDSEVGTYKPSKTSKMQKGSSTIEQGANPLRQEQILREKYASQQVENAGTDPGEKSFKPQNPTMIEENGALKPKRKKGEAPISDEGNKSPLKHKRVSQALNPADFNHRELTKNLQKNQEAQQKKVVSNPPIQSQKSPIQSGNINQQPQINQQQDISKAGQVQQQSQQQIQQQVRQQINKVQQSNQTSAVNQQRVPQNINPNISNAKPPIQQNSSTQQNVAIKQNVQQSSMTQSSQNNSGAINQQNIAKPVNAKISNPQVRQEAPPQQDNSRKT